MTSIVFGNYWAEWHQHLFNTPLSLYGARLNSDADGPSAASGVGGKHALYVAIQISANGG